MIELARASIKIAAPRERVFELFTTVEGLETWMARSAEVDLRPGGAWRWHHDNGATASGHYVEIRPPESVVFTYGWENGPHAAVTPGSTTVEVHFEEADGRTTVTVEHRDLEPAAREAHAAGWAHFLGVLQRLPDEPATAHRHSTSTGVRDHAKGSTHHG